MGDRRSLVPADLRDEQINVIAEFVPTVTHLGLRARLSNVSWFRQRRRRDMAEELAGNERLADNPETRFRLWQFTARAYRRARDEDNANRCMIEAAECHVQKADLANSPMLEAAFLQDAIQTLRNLPPIRETDETN